MNKKLTHLNRVKDILSINKDCSTACSYVQTHQKEIQAEISALPAFETSYLRYSVAKMLIDPLMSTQVKKNGNLIPCSVALIDLLPLWQEISFFTIGTQVSLLCPEEIIAQIKCSVELISPKILMDIMTRIDNKTLFEGCSPAVQDATDTPDYGLEFMKFFRYYSKYHVLNKEDLINDKNVKLHATIAKIMAVMYEKTSKKYSSGSLEIYLGIPSQDLPFFEKLLLLSEVQDNLDTKLNPVKRKI